MSVKVIGHIDLKANNPIPAYELNNGRIVTFHTAYQGANKTRPITFFTDLDVWPSLTAARLGISYSFMRNATAQETVRCAFDKGLGIKQKVTI